MPNLNRCFLMGNLTRDCELRYLPSNAAVVSFGMAINRRWKNQAGESQDETTFVDLEAFGKQAEVLNQYVRKGDPLFIEGRLKLDQWSDRDGNNRSKLKVVVESFEFLKGKSDRDAAPSQPRQQDDRQPARAAGTRQGAASGQHEPVDEDDIPF
jgi:single-strand DNA-binding protein